MLTWLWSRCYSVAAYLLSKAITLSIIKWPFQNLSQPERYGLSNAVNFRIPFLSSEEGGEELGAWFVRPLDKSPSLNVKQRWMIISDTFEQEIDDDDRKVWLTESKDTAVLYLHGNAHTRSQSHRVGLYNLLTSMGMSVLAVDYRGYADSSPTSTNTGITFLEDALLSFHWLRRHIHPKSRIVVWGHSLGTGITTALGDILSFSPSSPVGYVLEAPFLSMLDLVVDHYATATSLFSVFADPGEMLKHIGLTFNSGDRVRSIKQPIAILHAKDDKIVPYAAGEKLYQVAVDGDCDVTMFSYAEELGLGHNNIYKAEKMLHDMMVFFGHIKEAEKRAFVCTPLNKCAKSDGKDVWPLGS